MDWEYWDPDEDIFTRPLQSPLPIAENRLPINAYPPAVSKILIEQPNVAYQELDPMVRSCHNKFRKLLCTSFKHQFQQGLVKWPRSLNGNHRKAVKKILFRVNMEISNRNDLRKESEEEDDDDDNSM